MKFDFPLPLAPIRIFRSLSSRLANLIDLNPDNLTWDIVPGILAAISFLLNTASKDQTKVENRELRNSHKDHSQFSIPYSKLSYFMEIFTASKPL
jgi:hypothetical protein